MSHTERDIKRITKAFHDGVRESELPQPEEPQFMPFYNPRTGKWTAYLGSDYAGYFDARAEVPIFLGEEFITLSALLWYMEQALEI